MLYFATGVKFMKEKQSVKFAIYRKQVNSICRLIIVINDWGINGNSVCLCLVICFNMVYLSNYYYVRQFIQGRSNSNNYKGPGLTRSVAVVTNNF